MTESIGTPTSVISLHIMGVCQYFFDKCGIVHLFTWVSFLYPMVLVIAIVLKEFLSLIYVN